MPAMQKTQKPTGTNKNRSTSSDLVQLLGNARGLAGRLLYGCSTSCGSGGGLAFANVALGGGDGVVALLRPRRLLGPLRILPC